MQDDVQVESNLAPSDSAPKRRWRLLLRLTVVVLIGAGLAVAFGFGIRPILEWVINLRNKSGPNAPEADIPGLGTSIAAASLLGFLIGAGLGNLILNWLIAIKEHWERMESGDRFSLFFGGFFGLLASLLLLPLFQLLLPPLYETIAILAVAVGFSAVCVYALQSMDEVLPWYKPQTRGRRRGIKILDTNVIIDGRIYDIAKTGFLEGTMYVPGFVLDEVQYFADSHDELKRQKGRRGLEILNHLQSSPQFKLEVRSQDRLAPELGDEVDARLVRLARAMGADIVTNDFNLNRVAALQSVKVLNINDLALGLRPNVLPGETLRLTIIKEGSHTHQGVGYLEDGTMIVVENARAHIGESVDVNITQVIQTERGKMMFAKLPETDPEQFASSDGFEHGSKRRSSGSRRP